MLMSKGIKATIAFFTISISIFMLNVIVASIFFTNDKSINCTTKSTKVASVQKEELLESTREQNFQDAVTKVASLETTVVRQANDKIMSNESKKEEPVNDKTAKTNNANKEKKETTNQIVKSSNEKDDNNTIVQTIESTYKGLLTAGKIEIPKTGVNMPIMNSVTVEGMEIAPCLLFSTGELNKSGNTLIVGHNYNNIFTKNKNLQIGDNIYITTLDGKKVEYTIYRTLKTNPEELDFVLNESESKPKIMLSTCTENDAYRLIVMAK